MVRQVNLGTHEEEPDGQGKNPDTRDTAVASDRTTSLYYVQLSTELESGEVDPDKCRKSLVEARTHLEFSAEIYRMQIDEGRYFLHEHPSTASSWRYGCMQRSIVNPYVGSIVSHMCHYGMVQKYDDGTGKHVKKPIRWLSNPPCPEQIGQEMRRTSRSCSTSRREIEGRPGLSGYVTYARQSCKGLKKQLQCDGVISERFLGSVEPDEEPVDVIEDWDTYCDEAGNPLESSKVQEARLEAIGGLKERGTYVKRTIEECWQVTGKAPIKTKFAYINKGGHGN